MNADITPDQVIQVAHEHVVMFSRRVQFAEEGRKGYNLEQCRHYLAIWKSIVEKGGRDLSEEEEDEIRDAYDSGEWVDVWGEPDDAED